MCVGYYLFPLSLRWSLTFIEFTRLPNWLHSLLVDWTICHVARISNERENLTRNKVTVAEKEGETDRDVDTIRKADQMKEEKCDVAFSFRNISFPTTDERSICSSTKHPTKKETGKSNNEAETPTKMSYEWGTSEITQEHSFTLKQYKQLNANDVSWRAV